jgi:5-methylcytosine-specific restriction endonuclease McrA
MTGTGNSHFKDGTSYADWFRKMRPLIITRDGGVCAACRQCPPPTRYLRKGVPAERSALLVHHIDENPANNRPENLVTVCEGCHMVHHKSNTTPFSWFAAYAEKATRSMTSRWKATVTSLQVKYSSTTA